ncbi:hypothetical protein ILUMI_01071 [Ignelater luminosus]|uniref:Transmembrane protein 59 n=1 Tax=Ignelater luminosus TaxID=2038154 RepID=A0A8K0DKD3_IGNLU|nr:hypothetical protein ILUMI_01071 [Ignelater luminosus]
MLQQISFCCYFLSFIMLTFAHNHFSNSFSLEIELCQDICSDSFFLLPLNKDSQKICQRGCRFFNIIDVKEEHERDISDTNDDCHILCFESYVDKTERNSCIVGCDATSKRKQSDVEKFAQFNPGEQEIDSLEDILLDPLIRKQIQMGYDLQYKIPEAYIRTMPIDENETNLINNEVTKAPFRYQLICSKMIPVTIFVMVLLVVTICILKVIFSAKTFKDAFMFMFDEEYLKLSQNEECPDKLDENSVKEKSDVDVIHTKEIPV